MFSLLVQLLFWSSFLLWTTTSLSVKKKENYSPTTTSPQTKEPAHGSTPTSFFLEIEHALEALTRQTVLDFSPSLFGLLQTFVILIWLANDPEAVMYKFFFFGRKNDAELLPDNQKSRTKDKSKESVRLDIKVNWKKIRRIFLKKFSILLPECFQNARNTWLESSCIELVTLRTHNEQAFPTVMFFIYTNRVTLAFTAALFNTSTFFFSQCLFMGEKTKKNDQNFD